MTLHGRTAPVGTLHPAKNVGSCLCVRSAATGCSQLSRVQTLTVLLLDHRAEQSNIICARGVRLAKNDFGSVFGSVLQKNGFWFGFGFTKLTTVSFFRLG